MSEKRALESQTKNQWLVQQRRDRRRPRPRRRPQWQQQGQLITLLRSSLSISAFCHDPSFPPTPCFRALPAWMGENLGVQKKLGRTKTLYQYQSQVLQQSQLKPLNGSIQKAYMQTSLTNPKGHKSTKLPTFHTNKTPVCGMGKRGRESASHVYHPLTHWRSCQ